ncbi:UDP-N-acetylmuramate dehydrogenase [Fodinisporobacter ferrooxydans]|uniref:UDP-N-acetylenolpyruvoylglucosamine reductase n=1 Tax=Fodinisporobacter ferrooxydans TaxID=2901836 RepID=A0ABY4CF59_9BACL|nr:UDP-N-acetylmuramate dehydrogenase [Alicyclobacillaceae bacterium MYW30-H2]
MYTEKIPQLLEACDVGEVFYQEPLARHTTWRIGGPADVLVIPKTITHIRQIMRIVNAHRIPVFFLGRGSNLLVRDGGIRGVVVKLSDTLTHISIEPGHQLLVEAGRSFVSAANFAIRNGLSGLEFATGIPGAVGGAVMMNAGAHGGEVKDVLVSADVIDEAGQIRTMTNRDFQFAYRYSCLKDHPLPVVRALFQLRPGDAEEMKQRVKQWSKKRQSSQPLSMPNCGSVFRNPEGTYAGKLIEDSGLKGTCIGTAQISELHANFIVNRGGAKASDVIRLIELVQATILRNYGITLIPEVRIVGED